MLRQLFLILLSLLFVAAGVNHFWHPDFYINIMPDYLPWHPELVYASGVLEMVFGLMLLWPRCRSLGAWGIIALLVIFLTVHVHMLWHADRYANVSAMFLWLRLALQFPLIFWAWWYTGKALPRTA